MSLRKEFYQAVYDRIVNDSTLQTLLGGTVRLAFENVPPNTEWPFLVMKMDIRKQWYGFLNVGNLFIDFWHRSTVDDPGHETKMDVVERLTTLLNSIVVYCPNGSVRLAYEEDFSVPVITQGPHIDPELNRHAVIFSFRAADKGQVDAVL